MSIHDYARQISASSGISMTAAYAELSRRSAATRRAKKRLCAVPAAADRHLVESPRRMWLPYAEN